MITDKQIQKHIEENCRYKDGQPLMDEQAFYEGAKWMREKVSQVEPVVKPEIAEALKIAEEGWKRCFISYGRDVANESLQESLRQLDDDKEWEKYCKLRKQFSV